MTQIRDTWEKAAVLTYIIADSFCIMGGSYLCLWLASLEQAFVSLMNVRAGSGRTYTVAGDLDSSIEQGLVSRSVNCLAQAISNVSDGSQFQVGSGSFVPSAPSCCALCGARPSPHRLSKVRPL